MKTNDEVLKTYIKRIRESSPDDADSLAVLKQLRFDSGQVADVIWPYLFYNVVYTEEQLLQFYQSFQLWPLST